MYLKNDVKNYLLFLILFISGIVISVFAYKEEMLRVLYIFWKSNFILFIKIICGFLFCIVIIKYFKKIKKSIIWLKMITGLIFLPVLLLPILRCYFKVPFVFCGSCYDKCPWGLSRTFIFITMLSLNQISRSWCALFCPFGTFQDLEYQVSKKHVILSTKSKLSSYIILFLVLVMYVITIFGLTYLNFFNFDTYKWATNRVVITILMMLMGFFVIRFWCRYFCPIGTIAELSFKLNNFFKRHLNKYKFGGKL